VDETQIIAAIQRLHEQLLTLPDTTLCLIEEVYPDFDDPDCGPQAYLALIEEEIRRVEQELILNTTDDKEPLQRLRKMLLECALTLRRAGV